MFLNEGNVCWTASDLTAATACEFATLRTLDYRLGWAEPIDEARDPLLEHIAKLGDAHEARILATLQQTQNVSVLPHVERPFTPENITAAHNATLEAFANKPDVVFQPTFFDGEFFGYADFIENTGDGWLVCDAKLARSAKPQALIQLAAYADQIQAIGLPLSATTSLFLGNGERADFNVADLMPVFVERRERMRELIAEHRTEGTPVAWGDERYLACGSCPECQFAAKEHNDIILVAGLRSEQRNKLRSIGVTTIEELAQATQKPEKMAQATFDKLRHQARLQWQQHTNGIVSYELTETAANVLALLPEPSAGDLFFDFEGDPLYSENDPSKAGLEYLWGLLDTAEAFTPIWAHNTSEEKAALERFIDLVQERRKQYPDLHVYHYAPYETTALKRLVVKYQSRENELDDLLRSEVFVDLYSTVKGAIRVSQASYSIKKLEPLYMGEQLRDSDVADGAGSIVAYHSFQTDRESQPAVAEQTLNAIADYNEYDCLSTLRLRDWLLEQAVELGVREAIGPREVALEGVDVDPFEPNPLFEKLMSRSGPELSAERTAAEQAYAMLASSLDYYRREQKQYWWGHFDRLNHPVNDWPDTRDIFIVESVIEGSSWREPEGRERNARRTFLLEGDWNPGSSKPKDAYVVFANPGPETATGPEGALYRVTGSAEIEIDPDDPRIVKLTVSVNSASVYDDLPVALTPSPPPNTGIIEVAINELAQQVAGASDLPGQCGLDVLTRQHPRLRDGASLPHGADMTENVIAALLAMDDSYLAVQGPPGTGKTHTGSRVIKELVEKHGWRIGVVAQSHAVVENMLHGIIKAGLSAGQVAKAKTKDPQAPWKQLASGSSFTSHMGPNGGVIGGTAWDFANANRIERDGLDLLVIDEAGQFSLAPTLGVSVAAKRLLLLGDPQQLPQVSQGSHPEPINESALGWLMEDHPTIPRELGFFLADSYRMHPALCRKDSELSYEGRLESAPAAAKRSLAGFEPGLQIVHVEHSENRVESVEEAAVVVEQVQAHLGVLWQDAADELPRPLTAKDFLIVAPYNAQVACIRAALDAADLPDVRVGTVDKFQGQEAPIAMVSMTASSHGDVPRGMDFLLNRNRINVAISRAQWKAILIRSRSLSAFMPTSTDGLIELGAFIRLCQSDSL